MNPHVTAEEEVAQLDDFYWRLGTCDQPPQKTPHHHVTKLGNELTKPQSLVYMCVISARVTVSNKEIAVRSSCGRPAVKSELWC